MPITTLDTRFVKDDECYFFFQGQLVKGIVRAMRIIYHTDEAMEKQTEGHSAGEGQDELAFLPLLKRGEAEVISVVEIIHPTLNCPHPHHRYFETDERILHESPEVAIKFIMDKFRQVYEQTITI